jgi:hypothetical protein
MMKRCVVLGVISVLTACGGDSHEPEFTQRAATEGECSAGGTVLLVDGEAKAVVCDGADGANGIDGANGTNGTNGTNAVMQGLVQETVYCTANTVEPAPYRAIQY